MVFNSVTFVLVFLPVFFLGYVVLFAAGRGTRLGPALGNAFLLAASLFFYAWGEPRYVVILLASIGINYVVALFVCRHSGVLRGRERWRRWVLILGIGLDLGLLVFFKYMNFIVDNGGVALLDAVLPRSLGIGHVARIALPLGISFFTFEGISYIVDAYRGNVAITHSAINFGCYLTMFPHLVAGPVVRYTDIVGAMTERRLSIGEFAGGVERFILGLAKKVLIADTLGNVADAAFAVPGAQLSAPAAWIGLVCYSLQIYYDFSGYSDMAIGLAHMMGFTFPENFNYPYISRSIREFWRRWHITLSTWFRDYLYIPLGGNRRGPRRTALNLVVVFALCGFWHGAQWTFLVWGLYHGAFLVVERVFPGFFERLPRPARHVYGILAFMLGWVVFRAHDFPHALSYYAALVGLHTAGVQTNLVWMQFFAGDVYLALAVGIVGSAPVVPWLGRLWRERLDAVRPALAGWLEAARLCAVYALFLVCLMPLFGATYSAFIYYRF